MYIIINYDIYSLRIHTYIYIYIIIYTYIYMYSIAIFGTYTCTFAYRDP